MRKSRLLFVAVGLALLPLGGLFFASPVGAQCGSSASSCKNCHEVNAKYPVNNSGDWHVSHAFGDFCAFCHAGNVQAVDESAAHEGMIYPLSDLQGSCQSCHPNDLMDKAQVYAVALGVDLTAASGSGTSSGGSGGSESTDLSIIASEPIPAPGERNASGALIDYNRRYDIEVLGMTDTSRIGDLILVIAGGLLLVVGAVLVWRFEKLGDVWRASRAVPDDNWRKLAYSGAYDVRGPVIPRAQTPVVSRPVPQVKTDMPVQSPSLNLEQFDTQTQAVLTRLLSDMENGPAIIRALGRLDPALIQSLQSLERKDRDLLLAVVEQLKGDV